MIKGRKFSGLRRVSTEWSVAAVSSHGKGQLRAEAMSLQCGQCPPSSKARLPPEVPSCPDKKQPWPQERSVETWSRGVKRGLVGVMGMN